MLITRKSQISGEVNTLEINVTEQQILNWQNGMYIQEAMPNVSSEEREFIKTGITPKEWNEMFSDM